MDIDGVFSGGGMKAIAFVGAIEIIEREGFVFKNVAGTSAGAIIAALISAGFKASEIKSIIGDVDFSDFLDAPKTMLPFFPVMKWISVYWRLGLYKGDVFERWITKILATKGIRTFGDIKPPCSLKIIASDLTNGRIIVLPDDLVNYGINPNAFPIGKAVRMSAGIPYFFEPVKIYNRKAKKAVIVDGAVLSNFPIWLFDNEKQRPVVGLRLSPQLDNIPPNEINNAFGMFQAIFETMMGAHDDRYISKKIADRIIFIPVDIISFVKFDITSDEKEKLIEIGRLKAEIYLKAKKREWRK
ncbi:patatin-like phospholipase family protein [Bacillus sp. Marseille-P3661]|uniref:patatin-like phospholipase family protein n=1 Tax=Bacillus sp. Marseille-P3661 TaxID=1936234 RepID=UPI000C859739|nr:patatin-like phospholipase family protein [Bacillus sp. Marseille-P3661]